jgi:hypothetical protein
MDSFCYLYSMDIRLVEIKDKKALNFLRDMEDVKLIKVHTNPKEKLKNKIKDDLEEGFKQIRLHEQGKVKLKSARQLFSEL